MKKIYFDVDGVLRNFAVAVWGREPKDWLNAVDGQTVYDYVTARIQILATAPPTEYVECVVDAYKRFNCVGEEYPLLLLTHQPEAWRIATGAWVATYFKDIPHEVFYVTEPEEKLEYLKDGAILIDDNPVFDGRKDVVVLDRPYNKECVNRRIMTPNQLGMFLDFMYYGGVETIGDTI